MQGKGDPNRELLNAAALCRQLVAEGSVEAFLADHRRELFGDELFADLFPSGRGRPSIPADVVATVMVLQALEGLSDRDAARAWRDRISWKVAAGLALTDAGFDYSVLTYWRTRLRASDRPERIFDAVRLVVAATGVLRGKTRRALDSTLLDDAVATQDTVTQLISAIRRARRVIPAAASVTVTAHDCDRAGKPAIAWDDPIAKAALITGLVNDARAVLEALDDDDVGDEAADAVGLLALVAGQDVEPCDTDGTWRIAQRVAPDRMISTVDPDARHMHKSVSEYRDGYKAHLAIEPETGLITAAAITSANAADGPAGVALLAGEKPGLQVLADAAYGGGTPAPRSETRGIIKRSRRSRFGAPCRAGSTATTSSSTMTRALSRVPTARPRRSPPKVTPSSVLAVAAARYATDARPPKMAARSTPANTTPNSSKRAGHGATATSPPTTAVGDPWSNAPSPGSSPTATAASATAASNATSSASQHASQQSTCDAS